MIRSHVKDIIATLKGTATVLLKRHTGQFQRQRKWLNGTQWMSTKELHELQLVLLQRLVAHVYKSVPYYKKLMNELGLTPDGIQSLNDIEKFPIMRKGDILEQRDDFVSGKFTKWLLHTGHTGWTSDIRLPLKRDLSSIINEHAFVRRQFDWAGIGLKDKCAYLTRRFVGSVNKKIDEPYAYDAAMKDLILSTFHLSADMIGTYASAMKAYKVKALVAYPSAAFILGKGCLDKGISLPLQAVLTTSEMLGDAQREIISRAFHCKVYDFYGSAERICYIHTCEHGSYHIVPEYGLTELIPAEPPNDDSYRIVGTGFWNMAMPFIRYDTGDLVQTGTNNCPCGRNFPVVKRIIGRSGNVITLPSGRTLGATAVECVIQEVIYAMYDMPVQEAQMIHEDTDMVTLEYVALEGFSQNDAKRLKSVLKKHLPAEIKISIRRVNKISRTTVGKFQTFRMSEYH